MSMYQQFQQNYQSIKENNGSMTSQISLTRIHQEEGQEDLARIEQFIQHLKNGKQLPRSNIRDSKTSHASNKQSLIQKSSTTPHIMSPINNIRDIQQQLQNSVEQINQLSSYNTNLITNKSEDQKSSTLNDLKQILNENSLENSNSQNGNMNYNLPLMPQNMIISPQDTIKNRSQQSVSNSTTQVIKSPRYERENISVHNSNNLIQNNNEQQMKGQINQMGSIITQLQDKLTKLEKQNLDKKNKRKDRSNSNSSDSSNSSSEENNSSCSSSCSQKSECGRNKKKQLKNKQKRKLQDVEIERYMQFYLNHVHVDRYQLNLFRDSFVSENHFYKLKDTKDYKTLFQKTLNVLVQNLEKIKQYALSTNVLYTQQSNNIQLSKNMSSNSQSYILQQPTLSHASSAAQLGQVFLNGNQQSSQNGSSLGLSSGITTSKLGVYSPQKLQVGESQVDQRQSQIPTVLLKNMNFPYHKQLSTTIKERDDEVTIKKYLGSSHNLVRSPDNCQTERNYSNWEENQEYTEQTSASSRNYYVPSSLNGFKKIQSHGHYRTNITTSPSNYSSNYLQDNYSANTTANNTNMSSNNINSNYPRYQQFSISKNQNLKAYSYMPKELQQQNGVYQNYDDTQITRENVKNYQSSNGNYQKTNHVNYPQVAQSRESFGINAKAQQQGNGKNTGLLHKKNNLHLEDISDEAEVYPHNSNIESARFKVTQNEIKEKIKSQINNDDNQDSQLTSEQQSKRVSYNQKKTPNTLSPNYQPSESNQQKFPLTQQFSHNYPPNDTSSSQRCRESQNDNQSENSDRISNNPKLKIREKSKSKQEDNKKSSTLNEIGDFDNNSLYSKSSKSFVPNEEEGRQRFYTANLLRKSQIGQDEKYRTSYQSRISNNGKRIEQPPFEPCNHTMCNKDQVCIHQDLKQKQMKDKESHFFKTKQRDEKIVLDITQVSKRAKPAIVQKTDFDIITNNISNQNNSNNANNNNSSQS